MRVGLYPGSFDPITVGHIDIIERAFTIVDHLVIAIGKNATKTPLFELDKRLAMIEDEVGPKAAARNVRLEVISFDKLLVDVAREYNAKLIIRGLRSAADFEYETQMTAMNRAMAPDVETIFLPASPEVGFVSSTLVRQIVAMDGVVDPFVPASVLEEIIKLK